MSHPGELSAELSKLTESDDLGNDLEPGNGSDDDGVESVPPPRKKVRGAEYGDMHTTCTCSYLHRQVTATL